MGKWENRRDDSLDRTVFETLDKPNDLRFVPVKPNSTKDNLLIGLMLASGIGFAICIIASLIVNKAKYLLILIGIALGILFFISVFLGGKSTHPKKGSAFKSKVQDERLDDMQFILVYAEGLYERFKKEGLTDYMLRDMHFSPKTLSAAKVFDRCSGDQQKAEILLSEALKEILAFLKLPDVVNLEIEYDEWTKQKNVSGSFTVQGMQKTIKLKLVSGDRAINALAILCHECTHYFMLYHRLNWSDNNMNEQRTDVVANMLGFSNILRQGYEEFAILMKGENKWLCRKIGYITPAMCDAVGGYLNECRFAIVNDRKVQAETEKQKGEIRSECNRLLKRARDLCSTIDGIDVKHIHLDTPEKISRLQQALREKESRAIPAEIEAREKSLQGAQSLGQLTKARDELTNLCATLLSWADAFQPK